MALLRPLHVEMPQPRPAAPGRGELLLRLIAHENLHRLDPGNLLLHQHVRRRQICQWQRDRELRRAAESRGDEGLHRGEHIRAIALVHLRDDPSGGILGPERGLERAPTLMGLEDSEVHLSRRLSGPPDRNSRSSSSRTSSCFSTAAYRATISGVEPSITGTDPSSRYPMHGGLLRPPHQSCAFVLAAGMVTLDPGLRGLRRGSARTSRTASGDLGTSAGMEGPPSSRPSTAPPRRPA